MSDAENSENSGNTETSDLKTYQVRVTRVRKITEIGFLTIKASSTDEAENEAADRENPDNMTVQTSSIQSMAYKATEKTVG